VTWLYWTIGVVAVVGAVLWWAARAVAHDERKHSVSWWSARNGFRYTTGTPQLLGHLRGAPFDRGTSRDVQDLLTGQLAGRPAMLLQFSWYHLPSGSQSESTGTSGIRSGICAAAVIELPGPVPDLFVRRETTADRARGRDLQLESEQFNAAFRITGTVDKFSYDVLNPRVMQWLLTDPRARRFSFRLAGPMLVVWQEQQVDGALQLGELADFAATLFGMVPDFVYRDGYRPDGPTSTPLSAIPPAAHGQTPTGSVAFLQRLAHRGHQVERYEIVRTLWATTANAVCVKINVPTVWPVLMIAAKQLVTPPRIPRFDDGVLSGDAEFDEVFACGTPRPDFAMLVLRRELTQRLLRYPILRSATVIFQSEGRTPKDHGVPEPTNVAGVWVNAVGTLADQALADQLTEICCDIVESLPADVRGYHLDAPRPPAPAGGYPNQLPTYYVRPQDRV
jgi:hypothetical protein